MSSSAASASFEKIWTHFSQILREKIGERRWKLWGEHAAVVGMGNGYLEIEVHHPAARERWEKNGREILLPHLKEALGPEIDLRLKTRTSGRRVTRSTRKRAGADRLTVTEANRLAVAAVEELARGNPHHWHLLCLYGPPGSGKTVLLNRLHRQWRKDRKALFLSGREFAWKYRTAVYKKTLRAFRDEMRKPDRLVLDGIDDLQSKKATQKELVQLLDDLWRRKGTAVVTFRSPLAGLKLLPHLQNRLAGGLVIPIRPATVKGNGVTLEEIDREITETFQLGRGLLRGPSRNRSLTLPRRIACLLARDLTPHTLREIGQFFGGRKPSAILEACRMAENALQKDDLLQAQIRRRREGLEARRC